MQAAAHGRTDASPPAGAPRISKPPSKRPSLRASNSPSNRPSPERQPGEHAPSPLTGSANSPSEGRGVERTVRFLRTRRFLSSVLVFVAFLLQRKTQQSDSSSSCQQVGSPACFHANINAPTQNPQQRKVQISGQKKVLHVRVWFGLVYNLLCLRGGSRDNTRMMNSMRSLTLIVSRVRINWWLEVSAPARAGQLRAGPEGGWGGVS